MPTKKLNKRKEISLEDTIKEIQKRYGKGSIMKVDSSKALDIESISTGIKDLDTALGIGGIPKGRITEVFGKESAGKSTLSLMLIANCQEEGGSVALIDVEHAFDPVYAETFGVKTKDLWISQPDSGEEALQIAEALIKSHKIELVVIDTVAALTPMKELETDIGTPRIALLARLMSEALRKLNVLAHKANVAVIFLNQVRTDPMVRYGSKEKSSGGIALKFYASIRIHLQIIKRLVKGADRRPVGIRIRATVAKNKVASPFKRAEFELMFKDSHDRV